MIEIGKRYVFESELGKPEAEQAEVEILATNMGLPKVLYRYKRPGWSNWLLGYVDDTGRCVAAGWEIKDRLVEFKKERWGVLYFPTGGAARMVPGINAGSKQEAEAVASTYHSLDRCVFFKYPDAV